MKKLVTFTLLLFVFSNPINAQNPLKKRTNAQRTEGSIKIDGFLDEAAWQTVLPAKDFIQNEPLPGKPASKATEVRILYDNTAIYIGAMLYDVRDSILKELTVRDAIRGANTDFFSVLFDTYRDGNNGVSFTVSAAGVQGDTKFFSGDDDDSWNAVWRSSTRLTDNGWVVEMAIPYSALRFPKVEEQAWRINFARQIRRNRETDYWNEVDPKVDGLVNQAGEITGIKNIKSPVRLQAQPFVSTYLEHNYDKTATPKNLWGRSFNAGMDVKYGINDAFTLDMTLVPDFGQVRSDNKVLNLSPYEIRFDEFRQFFTEGVELFSKGNFFYSRRIGSIPQYFYNQLDNQLKPGETLLDAPNEAQLYNATKISGRTPKGLGIGVLNATSAPTFAKVGYTEGSLSKEKYLELTPLTNYNVVTFDQNLKNNSYVSFTNTNVMRSGTAYDANVTGVDFVIKDKSNTYSINATGGLAQRFFQKETELSHKYLLGVSKISGQWQWALEHNLESYNYNPNDLGFLRAPNESSWFGSLEYLKFDTKRFNRWRVSTDIEYINLQRPSVFTDFAINMNSFFLTKNIFAFGLFNRLEPAVTYDYFEPRTNDFKRYFAFQKNYMFGGFVSTDYRKTFALDVNFAYRWFEKRGQNGWDLDVSPRVRANEHVSFVWSVGVKERHNYANYVAADEEAVGYSGLPTDAIVFGERQQLIVENTPSLKWNFNALSGLTFRLRHYWTRVNYRDYYELGLRGELNPTTYKGIDAANASFHNTNFNLFNIDANYTWRFAPGSDLILNWKQNISNEDSDILKSYFFNASKIYDNPLQNSFSLKVIYFLDYLNFAKKKK
jgi:Domain of unknown function (DUF5916)/Carbohydrate family 9 binding domain-like